MGNHDNGAGAQTLALHLLLIGDVAALLGRVQTNAHSFLSAGGGAAMGRLVGVADTKVYVEERRKPSGLSPKIPLGCGVDYREMG